MSDCFVLYLLLICMKKKKSGAGKFTNNMYERSWRDVKYWEDPDYPFDWTEGEFC